MKKGSLLNRLPPVSTSPYARYFVGNNESNPRPITRKNQERLTWKNWPKMLNNTLMGIKKNALTILVWVNLLFGRHSKSFISAIKNAQTSSSRRSVKNWVSGKNHRLWPAGKIGCWPGRKWFCWGYASYSRLFEEGTTLFWHSWLACQRMNQCYWNDH